MEISIDEMIERFNSGIEVPENEYLAEDGLLHCAVCHRKTETIIKHPFNDTKRKVRCKCGCKTEKDLFEERQLAEELDRKRRICFAETNMASWNFQNDDRRNAKLSDAMKAYVENFAAMRRDGKGLLLHGTVGTGKTFYAACIANALIDYGYTVHMTNFATVTNILFGMKEGKKEYIDALNRYSLLIIDDLGAERKSEWMQEQVFNIIDARYRSGLPFIITTNLTTDEIKKPQDVGYSRIYDRILERCHPIEVSGVSRRRQSVRESYQQMNELLGL